jgi:thiol:disulfide interchange protein DsbD
LVQVNGKTKELGKLEKNFDKNFGAEIAYFSKKVQFVQSVTLKVASKTRLTGEIEYMVCNDERCLPPTKVPFDIAIQ